MPGDNRASERTVGSFAANRIARLAPIEAPANPMRLGATSRHDARNARAAFTSAVIFVSSWRLVPTGSGPDAPWPRRSIASATNPASASRVATACQSSRAVSYTHLRAHETRHDIVCRLLL